MERQKEKEKIMPSLFSVRKEGKNGFKSEL